MNTLIIESAVYFLLVLCGLSLYFNLITLTQVIGITITVVGLGCLLENIGDYLSERKDKNGRN